MPSFRTILVCAAAIVAMSLGICHFINETQPLGIDNKVAGFDHIAGRTLAEIPDEEFSRARGEDVLDYISRVTMTVHEATYHCRPTDHDLSAVGTAVTTVGKVVGLDPHLDLGLMDFRKLRCGYCSERSLAATHVLNENGVNAITYGIIGHVVTKVTIEGKTYFTDPDYGVGPYLADTPRDKVRDIYLHSSVPKLAEAVADIVADKTNDQPYFNPEFFDQVRKDRRILIRAADAAGAILVLAGPALMIAGTARRRRPSGLEMALFARTQA